MQVLLHFAAWRRGDANLVTDTYRELTGQAPTSLAEWVAFNRGAFDGSVPEPDATARSTS
jgi:hypothetical protein